MEDFWWDLSQWWDDSVWRQQIVLAVVIGAVGLGFVLLELAAKNKWGQNDGDR